MTDGNEIYVNMSAGAGRKFTRKKKILDYVELLVLQVTRRTYLLTYLLHGAESFLRS